MNRKNILTTVLILTFFSMAVLGAFMIAGHFGSHGECVIATLVGDCPEMSLSMLGLHIDFVKNFSLAVLLFAFFAILLRAFIYRFSAPVPLRPARAGRRPSFIAPSGLKKALRWISLHENSPNAL